MKWKRMICLCAILTHILCLSGAAAAEEREEESKILRIVCMPNQIYLNELLVEQFHEATGFGVEITAIEPDDPLERAERLISEEKADLLYLSSFLLDPHTVFSSGCAEQIVSDVIANDCHCSRILSQNCSVNMTRN